MADRVRTNDALTATTVTRWQCLACYSYLVRERDQHGLEPQVCIECRKTELPGLPDGIPRATGSRLAEHHARATLARERELGLEPLGIRGMRHEGRRYSDFKIIYPPTNREALPIASGINVLPGQTARITSRPQRAFVPERLFIAATGGSTAADWIIDNILIGGRSQFAVDGRLPGEMFAAGAFDTLVSFEPVQAAMDIVADVTYVGTNPDGAPFFGSLIGRPVTPTGGWIRATSMTPEQAANFWPMHSSAASSRMLPRWPD